MIVLRVNVEKTLTTLYYLLCGAKEFFGGLIKLKKLSLVNNTNSYFFWTDFRTQQFFHKIISFGVMVKVLNKAIQDFMGTKINSCVDKIKPHLQVLLFIFKELFLKIKSVVFQDIKSILILIFISHFFIVFQIFRVIIIQNEILLLIRVFLSAFK